MEWRLAFVTFLLAFCAVVLADRLHGFAARRAVPGGPARLRPAGFPAAATVAVCASHDWYVHFYRSGLTGDAGTTPARTRTPAMPAGRRVRADARPRLRA